MSELLDDIAGIYGPLLGLLALAILWPLRLVGCGIYLLGAGLMWCVERANSYFDGWLTR